MGTVTSICTTEVAASAVGAALEMSSVTSSHLRLTHVFSYIESLSYSPHAFHEKKTPFQYGPVIKLPLHISQCHMVNHMALTNAKRLLNIDQSDNFDTTISQVFW